MADFVADVMPEPEAISDLTERAQTFLAESGVDARAAHHVAMVLDELLTNVASHGAGTAAASVRLAVGKDRVNAEVTDCGMPFDPRHAPNIDVSAPVADRPIGGLGLLLVHRVTEGLDYKRVGDRNHTNFSVRRTPQG
jgi:anti-sigma regulatory factor (Ser/Thr protein kinase)